MKNTFKVLGIIGLMLVIGFSFAACGGGDDGGGSNPQTASYTGTSGGQSYSLKITEKTAKYTAQSGDSYELTVGSKKSTGTVVSSAGGILTLKPSNSSETFTANVSGNTLTALNGTITYTDGTTAAGPGALTGSDSSGGAGGTLVVTDIPATYNGKYALFEAIGDSYVGGFQSVNVSTRKVTLVQISNGRVSLPMWEYESETSVTRYSGNDTFTQNKASNEGLWVGISDKQTITWENEAELIASIEFRSITFNKGNATISANAGTLISKDGGTGGGNQSAGGTFTLTDIPSKYNGKYAGLEASNYADTISIAGAQSVNWPTRGYTLVKISNGKVDLPLWCWTSWSSGNITGYYGTETCVVTVGIFDTSTVNTNNEDENPLVGILFETVAFSKGNATKSWNSGVVQGSNQDNYSLDGVWKFSTNDEGVRITASGSTAVFSALGNTTSLMKSAIDQGFIKIGDLAWQNMQKTSNSTWSGQYLHIERTGSNVATGTVWRTTTFEMDEEGQRLSAANGSYYSTWRRVQ
jgi:hypothetical protein